MITTSIEILKEALQANKKTKALDRCADLSLAIMILERFEDSGRSGYVTAFEAAEAGGTPPQSTFAKPGIPSAKTTYSLSAMPAV